MKRRMTFSCLAAMLVSMAVFSSSASAVLVSYTDQGLWEAALAGAATLEDFEGAMSDVDFGSGSTTSPNGDLGLSANANFNSNVIIDVSPYRSPGANAFINGNVVLSMRFLDNGTGSNSQETVTVTLPVGLSAFAFVFKNSDLEGDGTLLSFAGTNGQDVDGTVSGAGAFDSGLSVFDHPNTAFFGVIDSGIGATITSFSFTADSSIGTSFSAFNSFDDVRYGIAAVPEPSAFAFMGLVSGFGVCVARYRKRNRSTKG